MNIDANGNIVVSAGTPAGSYTVTYQICTKATPVTCDTATETVTVPNLLDAVNDTYASVTPGTSTTSVTVSYTHLDVYKRQEHQQLVWVMLRD